MTSRCRSSICVRKYVSALAACRASLGNRSATKISTRCSITSWLCAALAVNALAALAQESVVVTGARLPGPLLESTMSVPRAELERASDLPAALRPLSTLHVDQPGAPAGFGSLYLRGADPNHSVLLLDGVKLNDISNTRGGGFDLGALDPRLLERVDVLPGATSAVYGADAMAGAVTLRTLAPGGRGLSANAGA